MTLDYRYYDVEGTSEAAIRRDLRRNSPRAPDGKRYPGVTRWQVGSNITYADGARPCALQSFEASLALEVTLPQLRGRDALAPALREHWDRFEAALREHERGHERIARECREEVAERLRHIAPASECSALARQVKDETGAVMAACREREDAYDRDTRHGDTQGGRF